MGPHERKRIRVIGKRPFGEKLEQIILVARVEGVAPEPLLDEISRLLELVGFLRLEAPAQIFCFEKTDHELSFFFQESLFDVLLHVAGHGHGVDGAVALYGTPGGNLDFFLLKKAVRCNDNGLKKLK